MSGFSPLQLMHAAAPDLYRIFGHPAASITLPSPKRHITLVTTEPLKRARIATPSSLSPIPSASSTASSLPIDLRTVSPTSSVASAPSPIPFSSAAPFIGYSADSRTVSPTASAAAPSMGSIDSRTVSPTSSVASAASPITVLPADFPAPLAALRDSYHSASWSEVSSSLKRHHHSLWVQIFERVLHILKREKMRQKTLAAQLGWSSSTLSPVLKGKVWIFFLFFFCSLTTEAVQARTRTSCPGIAQLGISAGCAFLATDAQSQPEGLSPLSLVAAMVVFCRGLCLF